MIFARMRVPGEAYARRDVDAHLVHLASRGAEVVPLQVGTLDPGRLLSLHRSDAPLLPASPPRQYATEKVLESRKHRDLLRMRDEAWPSLTTAAYRQLLAGLLADDVFGVPVRPVLIVLAAVPLLVLAMRDGRAPERTRQIGRRREGRVPSTRPGNRAVISWNSHPLPSGSLNEANER